MSRTPTMTNESPLHDSVAVPLISDPPPPYPSRSRRPRRVRGVRNSNAYANANHAQVGYGSTDSEWDTGSTPLIIHNDAAEQPSSSSPNARRFGRPRSMSGASVVSSTSVAPSLPQTIVSLFCADDEDEEDDDGRANVSPERRPLLDASSPSYSDMAGREPQRPQQWSFFSLESWRRYFRPLARKVYWKAFFHLSVINFPYTLGSWLFLFVFTVTGTTLLMALPLGVILCFFNLVGARAFARAELHLQTKFHTGLAYPTPSPPRPIFNRHREATAAEIAAGRANALGMVPETSFYRNSYSLFTDPTTYQSLFYFLVIKPAITLTLTIFIIVFIIPCIILVGPAPAALRAIRRLGVWQANVAVEGLYFAVR